MRAAGDEAREMRHVDHQQRADIVGDGAEAREVEGARIGRAARDDQRRAMFLRQRLDLIEIDEMVVGARSEEHTSELQSLMRISYAVFCLKKKNTRIPIVNANHSSTVSTPQI